MLPKTAPPTTEILLLQQKIDSIDTYAGWIIGGLTGTVTILVMLFVMIQFWYQRKLQKEDLKNLEEGLICRIDEKLREKTAELQVELANNIKGAEERLMQKISIQEAELARSYANSCGEKDFHNLAFKWWLSAAAIYSRFSDQEKFFNLSIKNAKDELEKVSEKIEIEDLIDYGDRIIKDIEEVRLKAKTQAELLENLFNKKIGK